MKIIIIISISLGILFQQTITQQFVDPALIATLTGHTDDVNCVAVIPSQQENIVSGSADKTIKVWESKFLHQNPLTLRKHTDSVNTLVVKPSTESFLSSSSDQTIKIWDSQNAWQESTSFRFSGNVRATIFLPSSGNIVTGSYDMNENLKVWKWKYNYNYEVIATLNGNGVTSLAILRSNENIVSGSYDNTIKVWNSTSFELISTLQGHTDIVRCLAILPSNENIVSGSDDGTIKVWNSKTYELISTFRAHDGVSSLAIIPSNERIVSASYGPIKVWDSKTFKLIANLTGHTGYVTSLAIIPSSEYIVSGSRDKTLKIWNLNLSALSSTTTTATSTKAAATAGPRINIDFFNHLVILSFQIVFIFFLN